MRRRSPIVAAIVAAILLVAALSPSIYTLSIHVPGPLRGIAAAARPILEPLAGVMRGLLSDSGWTPSELVRKAYSVAGFAVLGYVVAHGMRRRGFNIRMLRTIAIVAGFSAIIEVLQRQAPDHESWFSSLLDIACGAVGGIIGAAVQEVLMGKKRFHIGDHVSWNSEAGRVRGRITEVITSPIEFKGYRVHATADEPQYKIKSDKTDHVAMHKGTALRKLKD